MKLYAISDLHLANKPNRQALESLSPHLEDWLILAGDIGETAAHLQWALDLLTTRFAQILWTPGNHDLWSLPPSSSFASDSMLRGVARYNHLVSICRNYNVLTPEDPYISWPASASPILLAPLFLLYDYSFRPESIPAGRALAWAEETGVICTDEYLLHPDPYPSRSAWCHARIRYSEERLASALALNPTASLILINHFPLLEANLQRLKRIPRFSLWCGTRLTAHWHTRFPTSVVVYGHLHIRATDYYDGVRFEEVSLGYPQNWNQEASIQSYLREILPGPPP